MQQPGHVSQTIGRQAECVQREEVTGGSRVGEQLVSEAHPSFDEPDPRLHVVVDLEDRSQPRVERVFREDALCEPVQRRDRGAIDVRARGQAPRSLVVGQSGVACGAFELGANAIAQLGRGGLGERDRHQTRDVADRAGGDEAHDPIDEHTRLAGAGTGFDEQVAVEIGAHALAHVVVDGEGFGEERHVSPPRAGRSRRARAGCGC